ncbi:MAG: DNA replication/repair protein RecF [Pseudomonadaceae bacterium]|jgi:DNA replication and repair protein RecF|uniref:DNA replication and repair protein RecF n=1 Tax=Halopseudomonas formosensis TaxID=1002526 RepID=A0A1I6BWJ2_9GAMM|nr:DNA replication/repair protein RecF [Halopseudomonas formosensis]MDY3196985.1 DNA replication/repair protein RecF [Pseudomonadaceae bacterium]SFQ85263.1 DNA replication and repair protein RecF [Halopseudomonas formosensis]
MPLKRLSVTGVRNLQPVTLHPSPRINLIHGANGSGKTSLLEAIHLLGLARSFRSTRLQPVIRYGEQACTVFGEIAQRSGVTNSVGITRSKEPDYQIRMDGQKVRSLAELAAALPLQLINPDSFRLLEGAPKQRRQYLDWGVFHVEHQFLPAWQRLQKSLKQRNSLLRRGRIQRSMLQPWEIELVAAGEQLDAFRQAYLQQLKPVFEDILAQLVPLEDLTLSYYRGWDREKPLAQVLDEQFERDTQLGYTQAGAQRADLRLRYRGMNAVDVLSRGQQKLVVCALKIAQGYLMKQHGAQQDCVFLVDDLPSELDEHHRRALCSLLENLECQVFISCVELATLRECWKTDTPVSMFHVEHGHIVQTEDVWE